MKSNSLSRSKSIAVCSAGMLCAAMAFGMIGCASAPNQTVVNSPDTQTQSSSAQHEAQGSSSAIAAPTVDNVDISEEQALDIALNNAGLEESQIQLVKNDLDYDEGVAIYEIEFVSQDNIEHEYEISAATGDILSYESEPVHS